MVRGFAQPDYLRKTIIQLPHYVANKTSPVLKGLGIVVVAMYIENKYGLIRILPRSNPLCLVLLVRTGGVLLA